jgi:hypothetical protein
MLALRCAKYNGTFDQVFMRHQERTRSQDALVVRVSQPPLGF